MNNPQKGTDTILIAHASDLYKKAEAGIPCATDFLTPGEQFRLSRHHKQVADGGRLFFWGGCFDTERKCAFFLPDYWLPELDRDGGEAQVLSNAVDFLHETIAALHVHGSGYRELNHRDYLGSILSLGIERDAVGDICLISPYEAVLFLTARLMPYLLDTLKKIGGDTVASLTPDETISPTFDTGRRFEAFSVTAASPRLDCVVRALMGKGSREDAVHLIESGLVELNYAPEGKIEKYVSSGDVLSIRGTGKFIIDSTDGETKRGRVRISVRRYV